VASDTLTQKAMAANRKDALRAFEGLGFGQYFGEGFAEFSLLDWYLKSLP
jgi:hypothetical protein